MATVRENKRKNKALSYYFITTLKRDESGKQIRRYRTWYPPEGLPPCRARKLAEREAEKWERALQYEYQKEEELKSVPPPPAPAPPPPVPLPVAPPQKKDDFITFIDTLWMPLEIEGSDRKARTIAAYKAHLKILKPFFQGMVLQEITPIDIQKYLRYLRKEYKGKHGIGLSAKTVHHHYNMLLLIFGYAKRNKLITENPMDDIKAPKKEKKPVDAFTKEQAQEFLEALDGADQEFRCMMLLLLTTGLRRGELCGLQWRDFDFSEGTVSVNRNVTYTPATGVAWNAEDSKWISDHPCHSFCACGALRIS